MQTKAFKAPPKFFGGLTPKQILNLHYEAHKSFFHSGLNELELEDDKAIIPPDDQCCYLGFYNRIEQLVYFNFTNEYTETTAWLVSDMQKMDDFDLIGTQEGEGYAIVINKTIKQHIADFKNNFLTHLKKEKNG